MLRQLGQHISAARECARECSERARATADEAQKAELAKLEESWLELAESFEPLQKHGGFAARNHRGIWTSLMGLRRALGARQDQSGFSSFSA